jgi:antitoxin VapB
LQERKQRLTAQAARRGRSGRLRQFLTEEAWPQIPASALGGELSRAERERILGYGPEGV